MPLNDNNKIPSKKISDGDLQKLALGRQRAADGDLTDGDLQEPGLEQMQVGVCEVSVCGGLRL
jgi:hypothetical protein